MSGEGAEKSRGFFFLIFFQHLFILKERVCVCVCVCVREREREWGRGRERGGERI